MTVGPVLLQLDQVYKRFGAKIALRDANMTLRAGDSLAVFGANGAGKTTTLRTLATLARPTRGAVTAFGMDAWKSRTQARARIGVVAHQPWLYPELSCRENLRFFATMFGLSDPDERALKALQRVGLDGRAADRAGTLSRGLLQRLNLSRAIVHDPRVLILDEPDTGLDANGRETLSAIIRDQVERGGSVVLATHALGLGLDLATRIVILRDARIVLDADRHGTSSSSVEEMIGAVERPEGR